MKKIILLPLTILRLFLQSIALALGQIWANKTRSFLTTLGIIIGVASVIAVIASLTGLKAKVLSDIEEFGTNNIYINVRRPDTGPNRHRNQWLLRFRPEHFEGLLEHCPSVDKFALTSWAGKNTVRFGQNYIDGVRMYGAEPAWVDIDNRKIVIGRPFSFIDESEARNVCIIDTKLRDELRLDRDCIGEVLLVGSNSFTIVGVMELRPQTVFSGLDDKGNSYEIFIPYRTNRKIREPWAWAMARGKSTELVEDAKVEISFFLRKTRDINPGDPDTFRVETIQSHLKTFHQIALTITLVAGGVVGISLLVGGIGIMNIMLVSVSERTREIGLRKAVGAKKTAILTQFLIESVVLCFFGGFAGVGIGKLLVKLIAFLNPMMSKTQIPMWAIVVSFCFSGIVGIVFGMFPAIKASRLDPIEALRHE